MEVNIGEESLFNRFKRDYLYYFSRFLNRVMVEPDMIQIMLTSKCNIKCKICDVWKQQFMRELTTEEVKHLIDQAHQMGIHSIYFTGGEALLREDIFELINYASREDIITTVNTNGSFITREMAKKIVLSKLKNITFSIDSSTPKIHNFIRGQNVFKKAGEAIEFINYYKMKFNREYKDGEKRRLDVGIVCVIMKYNIEEIPLLVNLAEKMQCCYIAFQPLVYNGSLLENFNFKSDFCIEEEDIPKLEESFRKLEWMKENMRTKICIDFMPKKTIQYFKKERRVNECFAGFSRVFINPQGDISFVCFEKFGNVKNDSLKEIWHSEKAYLIRKSIKECKVNCTQFCSERPESEDIKFIHNRLIEEIDKLPLEIRESILNKEYLFLQEIAKKINLNMKDKRDNSREVLRKIDEVIVSIRNRADGYSRYKQFR